jgi:hypothetical protein
MATSRMLLTPFSAEIPASNFPGLSTVNARPVLAFDASTQETAYWTLIAPQGLTGALSCVITYMMASATSGNVELEVAVEAITDADATDLDATASFGTVNSSGAITVPGTAGYIDQVSVTLTNADSAQNQYQPRCRRRHQRYGDRRYVPANRRTPRSVRHEPLCRGDRI